MPSQEIRLSPQQHRAALLVLDRNRLSQLTEQLGLEVEDRRVTENHINALVRSRSVDFAGLLGQLKREELQAICDALGLDRGGREKEVLVQRILGHPEPLRGNMDAAEYKHVVLGLIFLKYVSDAFEERHTQLVAEVAKGADPEDPDEYRAHNVFWVPKEARWAKLKANTKQPVIGKLVDDAMVAIERDYPSLKGVLPKDHARPDLDKVRNEQQNHALAQLRDTLLPKLLSGEIRIKDAETQAGAAL